MNDSPDIQKRALSPKKRAFLAAFAVCCTIRGAAAASRISRRCAHYWMRNDPNFAEAFADARETAFDLLEAEARRRALDGWDEPIYGPGPDGAGSKQIGTIRKYSDALLMFLLKAARPERFRAGHDVRHSGTVSMPVSVSVKAQGGISVAEAVQARDFLEWSAQQRQDAHQKPTDGSP